MRSARLGVAIVLGFGIFACDRAPSADNLPSWSAADHDQAPGQGKASNQGARGDAGGAGGGVAMMVEVTWRNQCLTCHGPTGHGDGPQGAMFKAQDLSKAEWQDKVKDEEVALAIKNGKGRMPRFDLPDDVVNGLVTRIRSFRGK